MNYYKEGKRFSFLYSKLILLWIFASCFFVSCNPFGGSDQSSVGPSVGGNTVREFVWDFDSSALYSFSSSYIQVSAGSATLKAVDQVHNSSSDFSLGSNQQTIFSNGFLTLKNKYSSTLDVDQILPDKASSLIGYWKFDGNLSDSSGNGNTGVATSENYTSDSKVGGYAYESSSDGSVNDNIVITSDANLGEGSTLTASFWYKSTSVTDSWGTFIKKSSGGANDRGWWIQRNGTNSILCVRTDTDASAGGTSGDQDCATAEVFDGAYHHIVMVLDSGTKKLYVNGVLTVNGVYNVGAGFGNSTENIELLNYAGIREVSGYMDELAIWNTALTATDISTLYETQLQNFSAFSSAWTPQYSSLVSYWKMDGNWRDSVGSNHGTAVANATFSSNAKLGSHSGIFDGTADYVNLGNDSSLDLTNSFTLMAWFNPSSVATHGEIISSVGLKYTFNVWPSSGAISFYGKGATFSCDSSWLRNASETNYINQWTHAAITYDGSYLKIYRNGILSYSTACTGSLDSTTETYIGKSVAAGYFQGRLDEVAIWNKPLTVDEVSLIYHRQKQIYSGLYTSPILGLGVNGNWQTLSWQTAIPFEKELTGSSGSESSTDYSLLVGSTGNVNDDDLMNGLLLYWPLDETATTVGVYNDFADKSGNGYSGEGAGGISFGHDGVLRNAPRFDGNNDYIAIPTLSEGALNDFTFSAWVKIKSNSPARQYLFDPRGDGGSTPDSIGIFIDIVGTSQFNFKCFTHGSGAFSQYMADQLFDINEWHHVVCQREGTTWKFFIDGKNISSTFDGGVVEPGNTMNLNYQARIGSYSNGTGGGNYWLNGFLDEVALWNRALTSQEVLQLYRRAANRVKFQVRSCDDSACDTEEWLGKNTTASYFSELQNCATVDGSGDCSGAVNLTAPSITFSDYTSVPATNQYFQYRVLLESEDANNLCSSSKPCVPEVSSITVGPTGRYYGGTPTIQNTSGEAYSKFNSFAETKSGTCTTTYSISNDGTNFKYWDGSSWSASTSSVQTNTASDINTNIGTFTAGTFYFKAYLSSDTTQSCSIDKITVGGKP